MSPRRLIFTKRLPLPSSAANILWSLETAYALAATGAAVSIFPSVKSPGSWKKDRACIEDEYRLCAERRPTAVSLTALHPRVTALAYRLALLRIALGRWPATFYTRELSDAHYLVRLLRRLPRRHSVIFEMHECRFLELSEAGRERDAARARAVEARVLSGVHGLVPIGSALVDQIGPLYRVDCPMEVIPGGFNPRVFTESPEVRLSDGAVTLAYFGSLYRNKGVDALLGALRHLPERVGLRVIGGHPPSALARLKREAAGLPGGPGRVDFRGAVSPCTVGAALSGCSIVVIPQQTSVGFMSPIKLFEALGTALPIVATDKPSLTDILTDRVNAIISRGDGEQDLAGAVRWLIDNEECARAMQRNNIVLASGHTWQKRAERIVAFAERVTSERHR